MGGKVFWKTLLKENGFMIQKNIFSNHYRLIDGYSKRYTSSFNYETIKKVYENAVKEVNHEENRE